MWPVEIKDLALELEEANYAVYLVGGALRNKLLGKTIEDFDLATSATPVDMEEVFSHRRTILVGKRFGTLRVGNDYGFHEITTFRRDGFYGDGRHPSEVIFTESLAEDLKRRDFTVNAMAWNPKEGIVDLFHGMEDLNRGIIRTVGSPEERLSEDYLRMMRAVRFAGQLQFDIEAETWQVIINNSHHIGQVARERLGEEFKKIMLQKDPEKSLNAMMDSGILKEMWPKMAEMKDFEQKSPYHKWTLWDHTVKTIQQTEPELAVRLAAFFHDVGKLETQVIDEEGIAHYWGHEKLSAEYAKRELIKFGFGKELATSVEKLIREHMQSHVPFGQKGLKRLIKRVGKEHYPMLIDLWKADRKATQDAREIDDILEKEKQIEEILSAKEAYDKHQLEINGHDLINLGFEEGKFLGDVLDQLLEEVLEVPELNNRDKLIQRALEIKELENCKE